MTARSSPCYRWTCHFLLFWALGSVQAAGQAPSKSSDVAHQLWSTTVKPRLEGPVQSSSDAYYAGEMLMVPLHAAFHVDDKEWESEFSDHFKRVMRSPNLPDVALSRMQYLYLASRFIAVAKFFNHSDLIPPALPDFLFSEVRLTWEARPAWQWTRPAFKGMRERIQYKLNARNLPKSYYRSILDEELFEFAIAADLKYYGGTPGQQKQWKSTLDDVLSVAYTVYKQEVTHTPDGGWLLQPGAMTDHPDFLYAGNPRPAHGLRPVPVSGAAWDTSHFLRAPLWVSSMENASPADSVQRDYYFNLREGLSKQFFSKVLVPPSGDSPCYRTTNFMDGRNGVYRYGYGSLGPDNGYGPYQDSGNLVIGWWSFLRTEQSRSLYRNLASQFPWPKQCIEVYLGPTAGGRPHTDPELDPDSPALRLYHLLVLLASGL
jgi:hypothetical protein